MSSQSGHRVYPEQSGTRTKRRPAPSEIALDCTHRLRNICSSLLPPPPKEEEEKNKGKKDTDAIKLMPLAGRL